MSKEKGKTQNKKRKLTRQEKKQIDALIRQSKGDGKPHTAQDSIPFERMYKDGICRLANGRYSKCIEFEDINYQLAQPDDKTAIFEALCDMYNSFDASISVQLSLISRHANKEDFKSSITIAPQNDDFDSIRAEYTEMLQTQLERGNNGLIKTKFLTFTIEAKDIKSARARLARIETDTLNHFMDDIVQSINIILTTIPGSDPLRPEFGSNVYQYLDKPLPSVLGKIIYEATTAIGRWEKRLDVTRISASRNDAAHTVFKIEGTVVGSAEQITITTII